MHYHQDLEIIYVMKGKMEIKIDESVYQLQKGDFILINANKRHSCVGTQGILAARFFIDFHILAEHMGTLQLMFWCNTVTDKNDAYDQMRSMLDRILDRYYERENESVLHLHALYFELLHLLTSNFMVKADDVRLNVESSQDRIRVHQIQNYIQANYQTQIRLNDLAQRLYLSNVYLSKYIKEKSDKTFSEIVKNVRMKKARTLLKNTSMTVESIADSVGYQNVEHFNRLFKKKYDVTPVQYRNSKQGIK